VEAGDAASEVSRATAGPSAVTADPREATAGTRGGAAETNDAVCAVSAGTAHRPEIAQTRKNRLGWRLDTSGLRNPRGLFRYAIS
jgi:hypothetical protein